jgi:NAD(P)-dependent dehydrogenase (short-subunit alcohol dehydrogenase family)
VVIVSSIVDRVGFPASTAYSASKAAVRSFARTWAAELKDRNIRVNAVSPGPIDNPILDPNFKTKEEADATRASFGQRVPLGRIGRSEEVAAAVLFFASSDSSFSTGTDLAVDGGMTDLG